MPTMDESVRSHRQPRQAPSAFAPIASLRGLPNRSLEILHRTQGSVASFRRRNDRLALSPASARVVNRTERLARRPPQYRYFASTQRSRPMCPLQAGTFGWVLRDDLIELQTPVSRSAYPVVLRRIVALVEVDGREVEMMF